MNPFKWTIFFIKYYLDLYYENMKGEEKGIIVNLCTYNLCYTKR